MTVNTLTTSAAALYNAPREKSPTMKNFYVDNLHDGARVEDIFLISEKSIGETQQGGQFIRLKLLDRTGTIDAIKWDANECLCSSLAVDDYVQARGTVQKYRDKLQVRLDSVHKHTERVDPADFLPISSRDISEMLGELVAIIQSVRHPQLSALVHHFFDDEDFSARFSAAPAATRIHHAFIGGLLEHSLSVAKICDAIASLFPDVNRDLLMTSAVLHDAGKIDEFCWSKSIKYSDCGHLIGHIVRGAMMVENAAAKIEGFHPMLSMALQHIVLSHHGEKEWGSPKRPKCVESLILHYADNIDAKVEIFREARNSQNGGSEIWTDKHWLLERPLLKALPGLLWESPLDPGISPAPDSSDEAFDPFAE